MTIIMASCVSAYFWFTDAARMWHHAQAEDCKVYLDGVRTPGFDIKRAYCDAALVDEGNGTVSSREDRCKTIPIS